MRSVGIVVEAVSNLKVLGPLIEHAPHAARQLFILIPAWRKGKPYDSITPDIVCRAFPRITPTQVVTYTAGDVTSVAVLHAITTVILLNPYRNFVHVVPRLAARGIEVYGLDYFINSIYVLASRDHPRPIQQSLTVLKSRLVASRYWQDLEFSVQPEHKAAADRFIALGTPLDDPLVTLEPAHARHILGIAGEQPIISVFTPNIRDHQAYLFYGIGTWFALRHLAHLLRAYCDRRGYRLVVKSRQKQWDAHPFIAVADNFIDDRPELIYPSASALLLRSSKLAVHFGSMMVLEAALARTPSIGVSVDAVDKLHGYMRPAARALLRQHILEAAPGLFHFGQVSQALSVYGSRSTFEKTADSMLDSLEYAQREYDDFNTTFSGWQKNSLAADRIWAYITAHHTTADRHQSIPHVVATE